MFKKGEKKLFKLLNPESIAIVGASDNPEKIGNIIIKNIEEAGYEGEIFLVNPNKEKIGERVCYPTYSDIPSVPDLAIITIPAEKNIQALEEIGQKGTKNALLIAAGFKEAGKEGAEKEEFLKSVAEQYGINFIGPNCLGFLNAEVNLNATFAKIRKQRGNVRFAAQSGALASGIFDWAEDCGLEFKHFITLGNKANINENDILDYWLSERRGFKKPKEGLSNYEPVGLYLESITDGNAFLEKVRELSKRNPIVLLKPGRTAAAQHAMQSHTGAMAGDEKILDAVLKHAGVVRVEGANELFTLTRALAWENAPEGPGIAIISNAGGPAVIATDHVAACGLKLSVLSEKTSKKLSKFLPSYANIHNPVDVLGDAPPSRYEAALDVVLSDKNVHAVVVILTPQSMTKIKETAEIIATLSKKYKKPVLCSFIGGKLIRDGIEVLDSAKIPNFRYPEHAIEALGNMWKWKSAKGQALTDVQRPNLKKKTILKINDYLKKIGKDRKVLTGFEVCEILKEAGVEVPVYDVVADLEQAKLFALRQGYPVVLKIISPDLLHKTEAGGVVTNIKNEDELTKAFHQIQRSAAILKHQKIEGEIMIQKQIESGYEVIIGMKKDPTFGKILLFGPGGILTELMNDNLLHQLPISKEQLEEMILSSRSGKILAGYRNKKYALSKLVKLIMTFSALALQTDFSEIEINPIIVTENNAYAIDGRAII